MTTDMNKFANLTFLCSANQLPVVCPEVNAVVQHGAVLYHGSAAHTLSAGATA